MKKTHNGQWVPSADTIYRRGGHTDPQVNGLPLDTFDEALDMSHGMLADGEPFKLTAKHEGREVTIMASTGRLSLAPLQAACSHDVETTPTVCNHCQDEMR